MAYLPRVCRSAHLVSALAIAAAMTVAALADEPSAKAAGDRAEIPIEWTYAGIDGIQESVKQRINDHLVPMIGKPAPALHLTDGRNGGNMSNDDLKGKITVVDVWATWCPPCLAAIPHNNELAKKYAEQGVQFLGVTTADGQEKLDEVMAERPIEYPVAKDPGNKTRDAWKATFYPTYFIVDREGVVRGVALTPNHIEDAIKALLEEQPKPAEGTASTR